MLEISNRTPFEVGVYPGMDKNAYDYAAVVVKGTFDVKNHQDQLPVSQEQAPITEADECSGEPGASSVKYESDTCYTKKGTDVVLVGHAYAKGGSARVVDVSLKAGHLSKTVRVFGDRMWCRALGAWRSTDPRPFDTMPLVYERAFGGEDKAHPNPSKHGLEQRNPVGTGFAVSGRAERLEELRLPNLEDPAELIRGWGDEPRPAGFGFIGRNWVPRTEYAGTYDEAWQKDRCPLLPDDFDEFFFNGAHPDLISKQHFKGGESVQVVNASKDGDLSFNLPKRSFDVTVWIKGEETAHSPNLDTVIIEPDDHRVILVWRATVPCFRLFRCIDRVRVKERN